MNIFKKMFGFKKAQQLYKGLENLLNKILYQYTNDVAYLLDDNMQNYVDQGYKGNIHVYSVITAITQRCTGIPFTHTLNDKDVVNSEMLKLLEKPNPMQGRDEFVEALFSWLLITGDAYIYMISPDEGLNKGKPAEMWLLPAHLTEILGGGMQKPVAGYQVKIGAGITYPIPAEKVVHLKYFNPTTDNSGSNLYGQSPITAGLLTIQASNEGYKALNKAYQNGAPAGILTGTKETDLEYTPEQVEALQDRFARKYGNADNYMKPIFMRNPMQWIKMGYSVVDMNIVELMKYTLQDVCNLYHVPIHLFSSDAATLDNLKESRKSIYTDAVIPLFDRLCSKLNPDFPGKFVAGSKIGFDITVIPELNQDRGVQAQSLSTAWWLTPNERRQQMGMEPHQDPMMDQIFIPAGMITSSEVGMDQNDFSL